MTKKWRNLEDGFRIFPACGGMEINWGFIGGNIKKMYFKHFPPGFGYMSRDSKNSKFGCYCSRGYRGKAVWESGGGDMLRAKNNGIAYTLFINLYYNI
jgi:hypothetical protein